MQLLIGTFTDNRTIISQPLDCMQKSYLGNRIMHITGCLAGLCVKRSAFSRCGMRLKIIASLFTCPLYPSVNVWYLQTPGNLSFLVFLSLYCGKLCSGKVKLGGKWSGVYWKCAAVVLHLGLSVWRIVQAESGRGWSQGHPGCLSPSGFRENSRRE